MTRSATRCGCPVDQSRIGLGRKLREEDIRRSVVNPRPEQFSHERVVAMIQPQQVPDDLHVAAAEPTCRTMAENVSLRCVVLDRVCATERLVGAVGASWK